MAQLPLFEGHVQESRLLPVIGAQKDIEYIEAPARGILNSPTATGMGFWALNPYIGCAVSCEYCYARFAHGYAMERIRAPASSMQLESDDQLPALEAFERRILVKSNAANLLLKALAKPSVLASLKEHSLVIGTATDPYQPAERRFGVTRSVLEVLTSYSGLSVCIITKSPLVTRDLDLLSLLVNKGNEVTVHVSLITVDRELARTVEPRAPTPEARLRAIRRLSTAGIEVGVNCMPVLPGITDTPELVEELVLAVRDSGASYLSACALRLQSTARRKYLPFIENNFPELAQKYRRTYLHSSNAGSKYREGLSKRFRLVCESAGLRYGSTRSDGSDSDEVPVLEESQLSFQSLQ